MKRIMSGAYRKPFAGGRKPGSFGRSPRIATTFSMPRRAISTQCAAISSRLASMQVTCAAPSRPSARMRVTSSTGASRGFVPVRVTVMNPGPRGRSASMVRFRASSPAAVAGGKNSKEMTGRAQALGAGDEGLEALQTVAFAVEAERVHRGGEVEDELAARGGLEVEDGDHLVALHDQVVVKEVAVDDALRELRLEVVLQVVDLVVERAYDALEVRRQPPAHLAVEARDPLEAEAVLDPLLVALADGVQIGEHASDVLELRGADALRAQHVAVVIAVDGEALAARLAVMVSLAVGERLRAREAVLAGAWAELRLALRHDICRSP